MSNFPTCIQSCPHPDLIHMDLILMYTFRGSDQLDPNLATNQHNSDFGQLVANQLDHAQN